MLQAAGAAPGANITTYCHIGQQATVPYLVARLLGYDVKLFDGSYEEWSKTESAPVKTGATP
jgi:thiosulfate/3-mercaptopyruvate sulfurtransferase